jgi:hypothetical protein
MSPVGSESDTSSTTGMWALVWTWLQIERRINVDEKPLTFESCLSCWVALCSPSPSCTARRIPPSRTLCWICLSLWLSLQPWSRALRLLGMSFLRHLRRPILELHFTLGGSPTFTHDDRLGGGSVPRVVKHLVEGCTMKTGMRGLALSEGSTEGEMSGGDEDG